MQLGDRLRKARENSMLSQIQVKEITKINNKTLSNYENNVSFPDPTTLKILADLYGVTTDWLISGKHISYDISPEDLELLKKLKSLPSDKREIIDAVIKVSEASKTESSAAVGK